MQLELIGHAWAVNTVASGCKIACAYSILQIFSKFMYFCKIFEKDVVFLQKILGCL